MITYGLEPYEEEIVVLGEPVELWDASQNGIYVFEPSTWQRASCPEPHSEASPHTCHLELEALYAGLRSADCRGCAAIGPASLPDY